MREANPAFFARDVLEVAPTLLNAVLRRTEGEVSVALRITEVEAYRGASDPGSHACRGMTTRNRTLFGPAGHLYCYFIYGLHHAINIVVGNSSQPQACLIRAGDIIEGAQVARQRRETRVRQRPLLDYELARGPGCVAQCFDANLTNDGDDLWTGQWRLFVPRDGAVTPHVTGPRVGVSGPGGDETNFPWRYWLAPSASVSRYQRGRR
jgi:DNA-3-methyladenine glycosylase